MKDIQFSSSVLSEQMTWRSADVAFIKSFQWQANKLRVVFYCQERKQLMPWPNYEHDFSEISVDFKNVKDLKLSFAKDGIHQISGFDILDISSSRLAKINYQIEDYEDDSLSFLCEEIEITNYNSPVRVVI